MQPHIQRGVGGTQRLVWNKTEIPVLVPNHLLDFHRLTVSLHTNLSRAVDFPVKRKEITRISCRRLSKRFHV